jgi:hypothetical protein
MPAADWSSKVWRIGIVLAAVAVGMLLGAYLSGGLSSPGAGAATPVGPDVGDIRVSADSAGPHNKVDGVGVGFAQTEGGAVAAATNLVLTLEQASTTDRANAIRAYEILAAEGSRDSLTADMAAAWDSLHTTIAANGPRSSSLFLRTVPVGHELSRYSNERATVEVWTLTIVAAAGLAEPLATWETATVEVVWENGDWKVWSALSTAGPSPAWAELESTETGAFLTSVDELEGYRYVAG